MSLKLDEELARSILFGDGRELEDEDKIDDTCIRPIIDDEDLYAIKVAIDTTSEGYNVYEELHKAVIRSRKLYRGSGKPALFVSEDTVSELLLLETPMGEKVFKTVDDIAKQFTNIVKTLLVYISYKILKVVYYTTNLCYTNIFTLATILSVKKKQINKTSES